MEGMGYRCPWIVGTIVEVCKAKCDVYEMIDAFSLVNRLSKLLLDQCLKCKRVSIYDTAKGTACKIIHQNSRMHAHLEIMMALSLHHRVSITTVKMLQTTKNASHERMHMFLG